MPTSRVGRFLAYPIVAYRRWISPALPPTCRFYPSCSEYALTAIGRHGAARGVALAAWRLLRCQPFHPGGFDPVPPAGHWKNPHSHDHDTTPPASFSRVRRDDATGALTS